MSVFVPNQKRMLPEASRNGIARERCQRNSPSCRLSGNVSSHGSPLASDAFHFWVTRGSSAGSCTLSQRQPCISSSVVPQYSCQRRLYQKIQPSGFAIHASCGIEFAMASNRSCRLRARPSARRIDSIWSRFWYCRSRPRVAACTALTTERVGAGRSKSVTFPKSRSTRSVAADSMPPRIKRTIGKSDHEGCRSNTSRSAPISAV